MTIILNVIIIIAIWMVSLVNGTGIGTAYHTTEYADYIILILAMLMFIITRKYKMHKSIFLKYLGLFFIFIVLPWIRGYGFGNWTYVCSFLVIYIFSLINVKKMGLYYSGLAVGGLGIVILFIYNYGSALSGWNDNSIAMIGVFSYLIFLIAFFNPNSHVSLLILAVVTFYYYQMIIPTDSRSCLLVIISALILMFVMRTHFGALQNKVFIIICLILPLLIAIIVCLISQSSYIEGLNLWSLNKFQKPIFNGRDEIWTEGFRSLWNNFMFGSGQYTVSTHHNSAVTCLVNFGVVGYILWISVFYGILKQGFNYVSDYIVKSCILVFLIMYIQQSVELGIIAQMPNYLIYLPLGILLGRIKYLKECEQNGRTVH